MLEITRGYYELLSSIERSVGAGMTAVKADDLVQAAVFLGHAQVFWSMLVEMGINVIDSADDYYSELLANDMKKLNKYVFEGHNPYKRK